MKRIFSSVALVSIVLACDPNGKGVPIDLTLTGCTPAERRDANTALDVALTAKELACVLGGAVVDPVALAEACGIARRLIPTLVPTLRNLIGFREAGRAAGVRWVDETTIDAGPTDGGGRDASR